MYVSLSVSTENDLKNMCTYMSPYMPKENVFHPEESINIQEKKKKKIGRKKNINSIL